jgi:hypothetical protein
MYIRTLAGLIRALGGEFDIHPNFPDGTVRISGLVDKTNAG